MSTIFSTTRKEINWSAIILFSLGFWLSGSLVLDFILIPSLSFSGMMSGSDFASAGFLIFGIFNHIEIICASLILTGILIFYSQGYLSEERKFINVVFASLLLLIALAYTYIFTPNLTAWGLLVNQYIGEAGMPSTMMFWQGGYWLLEIIKFAIAVTLLRWHYRSSCSIR
jgi:hypothetical protein